MGEDCARNIGCATTVIMQKVGIVIVNWNTGKLLSACLESLQRLPEAEKALIEKVVVVDNDSHDDSLELARQAAAQTTNFEFIALPENAGFAWGCNFGAQQLTEPLLEWLENPVEKEPDNNDCHVLLLNPDTEVRAGALQEMVAVLDREPKVGIVGPKLLNPDGSLQPSVRPFPLVHDFFLYMLKLGRAVQSRQEAAYNYSRAGYVDQVMGAAFLIRRQTWNEVGPLDQRFFTLFEEVDYCKRAAEKGWKTYFTPRAQVMHVRAASFNQLVGLRRSLPWMKSSLHYARKHFGVIIYALLLAMVPIPLLLTLPASARHLLLKARNRSRL